MKGLTIRRNRRVQRKGRKGRKTRKIRTRQRKTQSGGGEIEESYPNAVVVKGREDLNEIIDGLPVVTSAYKMDDE